MHARDITNRLVEHSVHDNSSWIDSCCVKKMLISKDSVEFLKQYVFASIKKDKKGYAIGFSAVFLSYIFFRIFPGHDFQQRFVFLKTAENEISEVDFLLLPSFSYSDNPSYFLNATRIEEQLSGMDGIAGVAARVPFLGSVSKLGAPSTNTTVTVLGIDSEKERKIQLGRFWKGRTMGKQEAYISGPLARLLGVEGNRGQRVALRVDYVGVSELYNPVTRRFEVDGETVDTEAINEESFAQILQILTDTPLDGNVTLSSGDRRQCQQFGVDRYPGNPQLQQALGPLGNQLIQSNLPLITNTLFPNGINVPASDIIRALLPSLTQSFVFTVEFTVLDIANTPDGKWPRALGNVLVVEMSEVRRIMIEQIDRISAELRSSGIIDVLGSGNTLAEQLDTLAAIDLNHYALQVNVQLKDRSSVCESNDLMRKRISKLSDEFVNLVRLKPSNVTNALSDPLDFDITTPLKDTIEAFYFLQLFLNNIFFVVMLLLSFLGCMVVYALLLGNVESKTYEYGMLRALGMWHQTLSKLLTVNAMSFALPALVFAIILASVVNIFVTNIFKDQVRLPISYIMQGCRGYLQSD